MVTIVPLSETNWPSNRSFLPVHHHAVQRLFSRWTIFRTAKALMDLDDLKTLMSDELDNIDELYNIDELDNLDRDRLALLGNELRTPWSSPPRQLPWWG